MSSRMTLALTIALACTGLALGQTPAPAPTNYQGRVGKVITVQEANRPAERCTVLEAWEMADGNIAMQARSLQTNLLVTVVEQTKSTAQDRFLVYHWTSDGLPPSGCPVVPGMKSISVTRNYPAGQAAPASPAPTNSKVVQADAKKSAPNANVVQASATTPASPAPTNSKVVQADAKKSAPNANVVQASATTPASPAPTNSKVVQADAKKSAPNANVVQASATTPATNAGTESRPTTNELPRVIVQGQPKDVKPMPAPKGTAAPAPAPAVSSDGTVGRLITVAERGKPAEQCVVLEIICLPDGSQGMKVQSLCSGEVMTLSCCPEKCKHPIGCFLDRFRCAKCCKTGCECVCEPCPVEKVVVMPKDKAPVAIQPKPDLRKSWSSTSKVAKAVDPLLPPEKPVEKVAEAKPVEKPVEKPVAKPVEKPKAPVIKEEPKVAQKPVEQPKLPAVNPKDVAPKVAPPAETKIVHAKPLTKPAEPGVMVPVPLVPLATDDAQPGVPPPQPVTHPFETLRSRAIMKADAEPKALSAVSPSQFHKNQMDAQAAPPGEPVAGYVPRMPTCSPGPVGVTGWTTGPFKPATEVPPAIEGVKRASFQQDPVTTENTVYLMTVLQTSGTPSQREWAASKLCVCDPRVTPYVTETLVTVAKSDPAALVRVACIQSLVKLQAKSSPVIDMLQHAKADRDPRVADEAEMALSVLSDVKAEVNQAELKAKK
jgi:hypothetical protein